MLGMPGFVRRINQEEPLMPSDPQPSDSKCPGATLSHADGELLAVMRHDLKTSLTVIRGQAQLMQRLALRMDGSERATADRYRYRGERDG